MAKTSTYKDYIAVGSLMTNVILKNLPFVLYIGFLGIIYIALSHYSMSRLREIESTQKEIRQLRWTYISMKSELMYNSKQTEVEKRVESLQLGTLNQKPKKILIKK